MATTLDSTAEVTSVVSLGLVGFFPSQETGGRKSSPLAHREGQAPAQAQGTLCLMILTGELRPPCHQPLQAMFPRQTRRPLATSKPLALEVETARALPSLS